MQRSALKEEKKKKKIDEEPNGSFSSLGSVARKWYCFFCLYSVCSSCLCIVSTLLVLLFWTLD